MAAIPGAAALGGPLANLIVFGAGTAIGPALRPAIQDLQNEAWALHAVRPPDALTLAAGVAQGQVDKGWAEARAAETGIGQPAFDHLIDIANVGPGAAYAFELWRRGVIGEAGFRRAILRLGIEQEWIDDLVQIKQEILTPAELAVMVQRGIVPDPGYLPVGPPSAQGKVPPMPVANIDTAGEAAGSGYDFERMAALSRIIGLPASPDLAARMTFRGIIDRIDFDRAISEGNTRNEWAPFLFDGFREIPTAHNFVEERLRGWTDDNGMYDGTARHGMSHADTDVLFKISGRPISFRQVFIGGRRGGTYNGGTAALSPPFLKSLQESNIRPEWYNLAWAQRHSLPSAFVIRRLATDGDISPDQTTELLMWLGWPEWLVTAVVTSWTGGTTGADAALVKSARTSAITEVKNAYLVNQADATQARGWLEAVGVTSQTVDALLPIWDVMKQVPQRGLTAAQIKKAFRDLPAKYPLTWATAELLALGYTTEDAAAILEL